VRRDRRWLFGICTATLILRPIEVALLALPEIHGLNVILLPFMALAALLFMACLLAVVVDSQLGDTNRYLSARVVRA
jgi:hypothetical protein